MVMNLRRQGRWSEVEDPDMTWVRRRAEFDSSETPSSVATSRMRTNMAQAKSFVGGREGFGAW
jgi:hypothetical protein